MGWMRHILEGGSLPLPSWVTSGGSLLFLLCLSFSSYS